MSEVIAGLEILRLGQITGGFPCLPALGFGTAGRSQAGAERQHETPHQALAGLDGDLLGFPARRVGGCPVPETIGRAGHGVEWLRQHTERAGSACTIGELSTLAQGALELASGQPPEPVEGEEQRRSGRRERIERSRKPLGLLQQVTCLRRVTPKG